MNIVLIYSLNQLNMGLHINKTRVTDLQHMTSELTQGRTPNEKGSAVQRHV